MSTLVIAEAGVNHNGDIALAKKLVRAAAEAGADLVKFQSFVAADSLSRDAPKAEYQKKNSVAQESQYEMVSKLELTRADHLALFAECEDCGIGFFSTAFDRKSADLLRELGQSYTKIPSGELTNLPYLRYLARTETPIFLSTGMATVGEIEAALDVIEKSGTPREKITLMHCTTEYPAPMEEVNLLAMVNMGKAFGVEVGYSDHTSGIEVPIAAVALGATVIEKHFTLDRSLPGPDHLASLEPGEFAAMVNGIRNINRAMGDGIKRPSKSEEKNKPIARKSIVAATAIREGEYFSESNLTTKRPGTGLSPMLWDEIIGRRACRAFRPDELVEI